MCWIDYKEPRIYIAQEDIPVFKILKQDLRSYYRDYKYVLGQVYCSTLGIPYTDIIYTQHPITYKVSKGYHSYHPACRIIVRERTIVVESMDASVTIGIYWISRLWVFSICKAKCVIPKGSKYYLNYNGEYVSSQIKILEVEEKYVLHPDS